MKRTVFLTLVICACAACGNVQAASNVESNGAATWHKIAAPQVASRLAADWIEIDAPAGHKLPAAVFMPAGPGPFPVVVLLHASGGFSMLSAREGEKFAQAGFLAVAACWFADYSPYDGPLQPLIPCPNGPRFAYADVSSVPYVDAIVGAARTLPGADGGSLGLIGQSRGATMAVLYASTRGKVQAVVADSADYNLPATRDASTLRLAQDLAAPILILHGTNDRTVPVGDPREYQAALARLGKPYEAQYHENAAHVILRRSNTHYSDAMDRTIAFLRKHLAR